MNEGGDPGSALCGHVITLNQSADRSENRVTVHSDLLYFDEALTKYQVRVVMLVVD